MGNPKSDGKCLLKETHREEDTERRLWRLSQRLVMRPQAEASNLQNPEEAKDGFSPRASRGSMDTPDLGHLISRIVRITFSCFLPSSCVICYGINRKPTEGWNLPSLLETHSPSCSVPPGTNGRPSSTASTGHRPSGSSWIQ